MLLMPDSYTHPDYWSFFERPRREADVSSKDPAWRLHPLAAPIEAMLAERGLHERDLELDVEDEPLWATAVYWPHRFNAEKSVVRDCDVRDELGPALDHLVASCTRDMMIKATLSETDVAESWVVPATKTEAGRIVPAPPTGDYGASVPTWAVTMSTALSAYLARVGLDPTEVLRQACEQARGDGDHDGDWVNLGGVHVHYKDGRLHAREIVGEVAVYDFYGLVVNVHGQNLPAAIMAGAVDRRLSDLVSLTDWPGLLAGLDPLIIEGEQVGPYGYNSIFGGCLISLDIGTETVAAIPASALAAVGDHRSQVPRSEKPWLRARVPVRL